MAITTFEHRHEAAIMDDRKSQWVGGFRFANHRRAPTKPDVREKCGHGWPLLDPPKLPATTTFEHRHEAAIMDDRKSQWVGGFCFANHRRAPTKSDVREKRGHGWPLLDPPKLPATTTFENRHEAAIMDDRKS